MADTCNDITLDVVSITHRTGLVVVDAYQIFSVKGLSFFLGSIKLRVLTKLLMNEEGLVTLHEDIWSVHDLLLSLPVIGFAYGVLRKAQPLLMNALYEQLTKA